MTTLRCWQCGVEPTEVADITTYADFPDRRYLPIAWPDGDHEHAVDRPTPSELAAKGDAVMARIARTL